MSARPVVTLPDQPVVSVVVPMLNEHDHIEACLDGFAAQTYSLDALDVIIVDAGSTDGSRDTVDARARTCEWLRVVDNPKGSAAAAFNVGVSSAAGDIVCLFSAHGVPERDYVERSVSVLAETGVAGVGGRYLHVGEDSASSAIGLAMVSPFGMASPHRFATERREVDTISHPAYLRQALLDVGLFDESLERNSDYELNYRLRARGAKLVFDDGIGSIYRPRPSLVAMGRQFWSYGRWKARVIQLHPDSLRLRHLVAPAAVTAGLLAPVVARTPIGRRIVVVATASYAGLVAIAVKRSRPRAHGADPIVVAAAFPVMHAAWGAGFLATAVEVVAGR